MNIYLAGKMDPRKGAWRDHILGSEWLYSGCDGDLPDGATSCQKPRWVLLLPEDRWLRSLDRWGEDGDLDFASLHGWPVTSGVVFDRHAYSGPYRQLLVPDVQTKWYGWFHGIEGNGQHGQMDEDLQRFIVAEAQRAIRRSDLVFAYINDPEPWGTIAEIGYALALGKFVFILVNEDEVFDVGEFWFLFQMAQDFDIGRIDPGRPDDTHYGRPAKDERGLVRDALKDAIIACAAWQRPTLPEPRQGNPTSPALAEAFDSFRQIAQWTSDPRVRGEADRMLRTLAREAGVGR
jgi:hypothetical protein